MYASTVQSSPSSANAALPPHPRLQPFYLPSAHSVSFSSAPSSLSLDPVCPSTPPASSPPFDFLRVLQWNVGGLRARSTELLHFLSSHPVDLICIQESNLNSFSSFRIPVFSALHSDHTHSRSGILSLGAKHASGGVVIFVWQGLSFSELSTSSLSLLDPYSDYVGSTFLLTTPPCCHFLMSTPPSTRSSPTDGRTDSFPPSILSSSRNFFILGDFNYHHPHWDSRGTSKPCGEDVFDWVISSDLLPLNVPDTPTLLHRSFGIRSSPDISFAPSSLAHFCSWEVLQDFGSDHLPILLSIPLSLVFRPNERPLPSIFKKLVGMTLLHTLTLTVLLQRNTCLSLSCAGALFSSMALNAAKSSISFGRIKRHPKAWWSAEVESAVSERRKVFTAA